MEHNECTVVYNSQLHETLNVIHTCCGNIIIIINLNKTIITKLKLKNFFH